MAHEAILFNNVGISNSMPEPVEERAANATAFIDAPGLKQVDTSASRWAT